MFSIQNFKSEIVRRGTLKTNRYIVRFPIPSILADDASILPTSQVDDIIATDQRMISLRCEAAQTPGISLQTVQGPFRFGYGTIDKQPVAGVYEDLSLTFVLDRDGDVYRFFHMWMASIFNFSYGDSQTLYQINYKKDYSVDLNIHVYDEFDKEIMVFTAFKAFPERLNNIDLGWDRTNELVKIQIPFIYKDYKIKFINKENTQSIFNLI